MSTVVLIDVSHLFHKSIFSFSSGSKGRILDTEEDVAMFIRKVSTDLMWVLRKIGHYDKVIACMDSFSWRKKTDVDYKANRQKDDVKINWGAFRSSMDEFVQLIQRHGFYTSKIHTAEADDLIALWSEYYYTTGNIVHIISADGDLKQLIKYKSPKNYISLLNTLSKNRICFLHKDYQPETKPSNGLADLFDVSPPPNKFLTQIKEDFSIEYINPSKELLKKIFCGDGSDNISAVWSWDVKGKNRRITPSIFEAIYLMLEDKFGEAISIDEICGSLMFRQTIHRITESVIKTPVPFSDFEEKLIKNIGLIFLNKKMFPKEIVEEFNTLESSNDSSIQTKNNLNRVSLLEGTKYEKNIEVVSDIFKVR